MQSLIRGGWKKSEAEPGLEIVVSVPPGMLLGSLQQGVAAAPVRAQCSSSAACSGNCCGPQTANRLHMVRAELRHGFERSMDLLRCMVCTVIRDTEDTVCEMFLYVQ